MEADWAVALGSGDPVITVPWEGCGDCRFVPLRAAPQRIDEIPEAQGNPPLRAALLRLNSPGSLLWTAKCDAWTTSPDKGDAALDPYEMDAQPGTTAFGAGSYIDLLHHETTLFTSFLRLQPWMHAVIDRLRAVPAGSARMELVMRPAVVDDVAGFGFSCFVEGCGPSAEAAGQHWAEALDLGLAVLLDTPCASTFESDTISKRASSSIG